MTAFSDASPAAVLGRHGGGVLGASLGASASAAVVTVQGDGVIVYDCDTQVRPEIDPETCPPRATDPRRASRPPAAPRPRRPARRTRRRRRQAPPTNHRLSPHTS